MNYQDYTVEDFALDPWFRKWVLDSDRETKLFWESWLADHPNKAPLLDEARMLLRHLSHEKQQLPIDEIETLWNSINQITSGNDSSPASNDKVIPFSADATLRKHISKHQQKWSYTRSGRVAASVLIALAFCLSYFFGEMDRQLLLINKESEFVTKVNSWGQRSTIYLSDGTEVHLNAGSSIAYKKDFAENERMVTLHGEAFFEVSKDLKRPFRVVSARVITEALGTSFNVHAYDTNQVEVALVTGKVSVDITADTKARLLLHPGEGASFQSDKGLSKYHFNPQQVLSWKEGIIYFKNADEFTVFNTLEQWYGVRFKKTNRTKKDWDYTGTFAKKSLEYVLLSMAFAMNFEYEITQKEVIINYK
ncbi:FecR domain-containing protein [Catalinimonas sp. 4WD22]|uniref:FecR family protein n=1 Tax=Catalinimonas locisalis TaxID=3133978 RepID=UPI003101AAAE